MNRSPTARDALLATLVAFLALLGAVLPGGPARAAVEVCSADPSTGCINGTIRTAAGEPAIGVALGVTHPDGTHEVATGPDGRWSVALTGAGDYTVTLDEATLPAGETLRDPTMNARPLVGTDRASLCQRCARVSSRRPPAR